MTSSVWSPIHSDGGMGLPIGLTPQTGSPIQFDKGIIDTGAGNQSAVYRGTAEAAGWQPDGYDSNGRPLYPVQAVLAGTSVSTHVTGFANGGAPEGTVIIGANILAALDVAVENGLFIVTPAGGIRPTGPTIPLTPTHLFMVDQGSVNGVQMPIILDSGTFGKRQGAIEPSLGATLGLPTVPGPSYRANVSVNGVSEVLSLEPYPPLGTQTSQKMLVGSDFMAMGAWVRFGKRRSFIFSPTPQFALASGQAMSPYEVAGLIVGASLVVGGAALLIVQGGRKR